MTVCNLITMKLSWYLSRHYNKAKDESLEVLRKIVEHDDVTHIHVGDMGWKKNEDGGYVGIDKQEALKQEESRLSRQIDQLSSAVSLDISVVDKMSPILNRMIDELEESQEARRGKDEEE